MLTRSIPALACAFLLTAACAQTRRGPAPPAPQNVLRAVSVYEWTGDLAKPTAARVVPVSLFIDHHFEDAALYLSRPMPLALEPGNLYELESAGVNQGTLTLINAGHLRNANPLNSFDTGWFGYATWKPLPAPKPYIPSTTVNDAHVITSGEGRPHFAKSPEPSAPAASSAPTAPAPTATPAPSATQTRPADAPPVDPDRPVLHHTAPGDPQRSDQQSTSTQSTGTQTTTAAPPATVPSASAPAPSTSPSTPAPAPSNSPSTPPSTPSSDQTKPDSTGADRPTFHHPAPTDTADKNKKKKHTNSSASVTDAGGLLADDPGRPHLHHGGATTAAALPQLHGLPADMHQMVAVSDAAERPEHNFAYEWIDPTQKATLLTKFEALARAALPPAPAPPTPKPVHKSIHTRAKKTPPPAPVELLDEELHAYEISYGGVNVFVYTAHTAGEGAALQYITLLAQPDIYGAPHLLLQSVTNAAKLDQTPRMIFIDAVDADGDNRAELLFELRGQSQRQFALYRIAQDTATQDFLTSVQ